MNIISEVISKLQSDVATRYGESIPDFEFDGNIKRFNKMATWVVGREWEFKGKSYCMVQFGNWRAGDGTHRIDSFEKSDLKNKSFRKDFEAKMELINQKIANERQEKNDKCKKDWTPRWKKADKDELHEYLIDKGIEKTYGTRVEGEVLLIPVYDTDGFVGVQRIYRNPETGDFDKRFASGIKIKGSICPLKKFKHAELVYISEGFATACSIQDAFPSIPSICAFNAGNLYPAIETIRSINPSCKIIIAADRDKESNTGEIKARYCVSKFPLCTYKIPKFKNDNNRWTDFNDLHQFNSLKSVQDQLKLNESDFIVINALGVNGPKFHYMSSMNPQVIELATHNHTERHLYGLVPDKYWWLKNYPKFDPEDELKEHPTGIDWTKAGNSLMKQCLDKKMFEFSNVRSSGVWNDEGKIYYHNGSQLYNGSKYIDVFSNGLSKNYVMGKNCYSIKKNEQLSEIERGNLLELFSTIATKTPEQGLLLLGWVMSAPIAGGLPWRPHIWLTGQSSAGKSWTMENIITKLLEGFCINPQGDSTEAGIRQAVGNQSLPLVFDEFETDDLKTSAKTEAVIGLARQASTPSTGDIMRGTSGGTVMTFSPNFALCASSINPNLSHKQDKNRWTVIEFSPERSGNEQFEKVQEIVEKTFTPDISRKLVSYVFHNFDIYLENFHIIEKYLKRKKYKGHFCRQYASLLAGLLLVIQNESIDESAIEVYLNKFNFQEWLEKTGDDDDVAFIDKITSSMIKVNMEDMTIEEVINKTNLSTRGCMYQKSLMRYGIKAGTDCFYVKRSSNDNLTQLLGKTKWKNNWSIALTRVEGASNNNNKPVRMNGKTHKVIRIPFKRWEL